MQKGGKIERKVGIIGIKPLGTYKSDSFVLDLAMLKRFPHPQLSQQWQGMLKQHPSQTISTAVFLTLGLFVPQAAMNWRSYQDFNHIRQQELRLQHLSDRATYLDEVLTMSARMNAATGDRTWEQRYHQFVPQLDTVIQESMSLAPEAYTQDNTKQIDRANQALIALEERSFQLVQQNQQQAALLLLASADYKTQKQIYATGVAQRNLEIQQQLQIQSNRYKRNLGWSWGMVAGSIFLLIPTWWLVLQLLRSYLHDRTVAEAALHQKNQDLTIALENLQQAQRLIQAEKLSSLGQMVAGIAHEMNNPVGFIQGNLLHVEQYSMDLLHLIQLYQQHILHPPTVIREQIAAIDLDFLTHDLPKILHSMRSGTHRIEEIVMGLRTFSHLHESERKTVDLHAGLESAILLLQHRLHALPNQSAIQLVRAYSKLPVIECCPSQLNQVFYNILSNAIEAIKQANPTDPTLQIQTELVDHQWVRIVISDNGSGILPEIQAKVFDPFFTTKPVGQGRGLGLSISYQIVVEYHQGKLHCSSTPNQETAFFIELPLQFFTPIKCKAQN